MLLIHLKQVLEALHTHTHTHTEGPSNHTVSCPQCLRPFGQGHGPAWRASARSSNCATSRRAPPPWALCALYGVPHHTAPVQVAYVPTQLLPAHTTWLAAQHMQHSMCVCSRPSYPASHLHHISPRGSWLHPQDHLGLLQLHAGCDFAGCLSCLVCRLAGNTRLLCICMGGCSMHAGDPSMGHTWHGNSMSDAWPQTPSSNGADLQL